MPVCLGLNVMLILHDLADVSVEQLLDQLKSPGFVPPIDMGPTVSVPTPVLATLTSPDVDLPTRTCPKLIDAGDTETFGGCPAWLTENVCPAAVMEPDLLLAPVFAVTLYLTVPDPPPLAPDVILIHELLLAAVHVQPV